MKVQVTIIGLGQIGASIGLALAEHKDLVVRVGHDKDIRTANHAKSQGAVDRVDINLPNSVESASVVALALPLDQIRETLQVIAPDLKEDAIVLDTAPVKEAVARWAKELLPAHRYYVGLAPVLNPSYLETHESGLDAAHPDLFRNSIVGIVSPPGTPSEAIKLATDFVRLLGAEHLFMDPVEVDSLMAATHILPQLLSAALLNTTVNQPGWREGRKLAGRAYAEATSPSVLMGDARALASAALLNHEHVTRVIDTLIATLNHLRADIYNQDARLLVERLERARAGRERWWRERQTGNWSVEDTAPPVPMPSAKEVIGRMFGAGLRPRKDKPGAADAQEESKK
jgi:prephenate dehydrogenase